MKLNFKKKRPVKVSVSDAPDKDLMNGIPEKVIIREEGHPRRVKVYSAVWSEVFSSKVTEEIDSAREVMHAHIMSVYVLLDPETGDRMVMTSDSFFSEARRELLAAGMKPWGVA